MNPSLASSLNQKGQYLLSIEPIPPTQSGLPAYFVGSTAPNNVEDGVSKVDDPAAAIAQIAAFLQAQGDPELLIAVHGYNTALGEFASEPGRLGKGVKGWYQNIHNHIEQRCDRRSKGLVFIGYRWPSEQVKGSGNDTLRAKIRYAQASLPFFFKVILGLAFAVLGSLVIAAFDPAVGESVGFSLLGVTLLVLATLFVSIVLTLFLLRVSGYFRDTYRANHYGIPDLVELIRQLDKALVEATPTGTWSDRRRIKLSFIGHSMGSFVVTDTVRILSNVFDRASIGNLGTANKAKVPSAEIGNVFSLGRLVLVAPDIPAESIISGRANFLSSSMRRFEETYLFSNEGDMALRLASTAANYASFPARTRQGGYRLGNVVVRSPQEGGNQSPRYGIVNYQADSPTSGHLLSAQPRPEGGFEPKPMAYPRADGNTGYVSAFLEYLFVLRNKPLSQRQLDILEPDQRPIAELFTVFDCTDYYELLPGAKGRPGKKVGLLTKALGRRSLNFWNYVSLALDMFSGALDSHGGYFYTAPDAATARRFARPDAQRSKQLIYGLACLGFESFLASLETDPGVSSSNPEGGSDLAAQGFALANAGVARAQRSLQVLSDLCAQRHIQVLLAAERYNRDVLGIVTPGDRSGY